MMQKIKILAVGKIKERALADLAGEYSKRLGRYCALETVELQDESVGARESGAEIIKHTRAEAGRVMERLKQDAYVIALDMKGRALRSEEFADTLRALFGLRPEIAFVVGGSHGLHPDVTARADFVLSLSNLTFPHQLARVILLEQIYRALKIINNETYHK